MTHSVTPLAASWRYRRGKCQQPCMGSEKENHSGRLCPLFKQYHRGGGGRGVEEEPGEEGIRGKKFLTAAQPEAQNMWRSSRHRVTSHPSSPVIILPLAEHTRRLSGTHMHTYTTTHCLRCLDLLLNAASIRSSNMANLNEMEKQTAVFSY